MAKFRTIIIEDEAPAREILRHYLKDHNEIDIIAECSDGFAGLKSISEMKPDLVFLDIQMPKLTGFEMLEVLDEKPAIIFTTAYDQYAIRAFELNAVDYLLKPFPKERLTEALNKAMAKIVAGKGGAYVPGDMLPKKPDIPVPLNRIVVRKGNSISIIPIDQVKYVEAQDDYVMIYYSTGKALKQQTMKFYEDNLPKTDFVRIHRSYIVRVEEIKRIEPYGKDNHVAILHSGDRLSVSRAGYKHLKEELSF
jgi:two-component system, LytTR family, response regulator